MTTLAQAKAEKHRQQLVAAASQKWKKAVKEMGLPGIALRSGLRAIEASKSPGQAVNGLIREYQGRKVQAAETSPLADLSDVQELRVKLYRARGSSAWFPSDPQAMALARLDRAVVAGFTLAEFEDRAREITAMPLPYPKHLLEDEKLGMGGHDERNLVTTGECPEHMKKVARR